jgi:hypothetical protein
MQHKQGGGRFYTREIEAWREAWGRGKVMLQPSRCDGGDVLAVEKMTTVMMLVMMMNMVVVTMTMMIVMKVEINDRDDSDDDTGAGDNDDDGDE